ncbi:hypothetical protein [Argonema antarcticum]|uniref:hypothetical protein n=1 Tax=Argonema antarcticum TaxID=2942763 RepID=UPI0020124103|nr:hypothetical protein [Argonema antarcticum]MCL1469083.1 hypothetical protein [Argonema antarcticum A004/B2]
MTTIIRLYGKTEMFLIDTSVWIGVFRDRTSPFILLKLPSRSAIALITYVYFSSLLHQVT